MRRGEPRGSRAAGCVCGPQSWSRKARSASSPCTANTIRSRLPECSRAADTMIRAASSSGKPPTPVPNATSASERAPSSSAFASVARVACSMISPEVGPPSSIVAAWITQRQGMSPAVVSTASPSPIGALASDSRCTSGPPAREIAPATPPPCRSIVFAALAIASTSRVVMSVSRTSTVAAIRRRAYATSGGSGDLGRLVLALQALAPALDGGDELREVDLERVEDLVGVVLGTEPDLPLAGARVLDDVLGGALGLLGDLLLGDQLALALARLLDDPLGLALGLGEHLLTLLDDPARLLDLLRDRRAHLVEDVVDLLFVHADLVRQRDLLGVVDEVVQLVDQYQDVHGAP